jgi:hypothetical protein
MTPTILEQEIRNQWFFYSINLWEENGAQVATSENSFQPTRGFFLLLFVSFVVWKVWQICPICEAMVCSRIYVLFKKTENFQKQIVPPAPPPKTPQTPTSTQIMGGILNFATPLTDPLL